MKYSHIIAATCLAAVSIQAEIIPIELSPPGTSAAVGLSSLNEVPPVEVASEGTGGSIFTGSSFDTESKTLAISVGYGSFAGFTDLTGVAVAAHIHGPADTENTAPPIFNFGAEMQTLQAPDPTTGGVIIGGAVLTDEQVEELMAGQYYINIHTELNAAGEIRGQLIPMINYPPEIVCPAPVEAECDPMTEGTMVELVANVSDEDGDALVVVWTVNGEVLYTEDIPATDEGATVAESTFEVAYGVGEHTVEVSVHDGTAEPVSCMTTVTIADTTAPVIKQIGTFPRVLWPPNHKMVPVRVRLRAIDCSEVHSEIIDVTSNEPINGTGDGNTSPDWEIVGDMKLLLRAERAGSGNGRVYTVTVRSVDTSGNSTMSEVKVRVPHDMGDRIIPPSDHNEYREKEDVTKVRKENNSRKATVKRSPRSVGIRYVIPTTADGQAADAEDSPGEIKRSSDR